MTVNSGDLPVQGEQRYELFVQIFVRHEPGLRSFLRPLLPSWDDVEEVLQQTCVVLWRKFGEFETDSDFLAWACTVARFEVLKHRRKMARDRHVFGEELLTLLADEGLEEVSRRERERHALEGCIERLEPQQRELIRRCYAAGASIKEVAESLSRSVTGLYKVLRRIRRLLLECVDRSIAEEGSV